MDIIKALKEMFKYQDKISKAKKYKNNFIERYYKKWGGSNICSISVGIEIQCCDQTENEKEMCYGCKVINFYRKYIRKYSAKKRSILMKLRHYVKDK